MAKSKNTYSKGMNQDTSRSKYDPSNYFEANNIRVVTHDGLSTGSIENENGTAVSFTIPDLPSETSVEYLDGTAGNMFSQHNLQIIGWCNLDNNIVIFTTGYTLAGVATGSGQIWKLDYDEATGEIAGLVGGQLVPSVHLRYNQLLGFSIDHRIEAVGRYENSATLRVYWTDNVNELRTVNLLDPDLRDISGVPTRTINPLDLDVRPEVTFSHAEPISVGLGLLAAGAKVQYASRLISSQGVQTVVSPASHLVSLTDKTPNTGNIVDFFGAAANSSKSKSVTFRVTDIDTDFDIIEHIAVVYISNNAPTIYKFGEDSIPTSGTLDVVLTGAEDIITLSKLLKTLHV